METRRSQLADGRGPLRDPLRDALRDPLRTGTGGGALAVAEPALLEADHAQRPFDNQWVLPSIDLLTDRADLAAGRTDHGTNIRIIEEKLQSFDIPAEVIAT